MKTPRFLPFLFLTIAFHQGHGLSKNVAVRTPPDLSSVVLLKCAFENDNMTDFFIDLALNETTCPIKDCNASVSDIIQAAEIHQFNSSFLANNSKSLNVTGANLYNAIKSCNMTVNSSLFYLNLFDTTFSEIYDTFVRRINDPINAIPNILKILNVSSNGFFTELTFGTDLTRLQILSTGNYSLNNLKLMMQNTNLTVIDMVGSLPLNKIAKHVEKVNSTKLSDFVNNLGITSKNVKNFFSALNISSNRFVSYTTFAKIQAKLDDYLNQDGALGVFISKTEVVTSSRAVVIQKNITEFVLNYTTFYLQAENTLVRYKVKNVSLESGKFINEVAVINSQTPFLGAPSNIGLIYNATKIFNCTYVTKLSNGTLITENFYHAPVDKTSFWITKSNKTIYLLGSPMYCQNRMYGLAIENTTNNIRFTKFKTYNITAHPTKPGTSTTPDTSSGIFLTYNFITVLFAIAVVNYFN